MQIHKSSQRAITLVEITIVLGIMGIIIGGLWILTAGAMNNRKKQHLAEQVLTITRNTRDYYAHQDRSNIATTIINNAATDPRAARIFPADMLKTGGSILHSYGGAVTVTPGAVGFTLNLLSLPADVCQDLVYTRLGSNKTAADNVGLVRYGNINKMYAELPVPMANVTMTAACPNPVNLTLIFNY